METKAQNDMLQDIINNKKDQFKFWSLLYLIPILTFMKSFVVENQYSNACRNGHIGNIKMALKN
jgi:hypothetical protein